MRLNKFLALATDLSRRTADAVIQNREVTINGQIASLGQEVDPRQDRVIWKRKTLQIPLEKRVFALNKPAHTLTSRSPQGNAQTVYDLLPSAFRDLKYAGRLDQDTLGLLIFTDDGSLIESLTHPRFAHEKEYLVESRSPITPEALVQLRKGVELEDGFVRPRNLKQEGKTTLRLTLTQGKKRIVRRLCAQVGLPIQTLIRIRIGKLRLSDLQIKVGEGRLLTPPELTKLTSK